jgi:DNA-binding winged helix-turn-helix (wHTH) protein/TolB-like protein
MADHSPNLDQHSKRRSAGEIPESGIVSFAIFEFDFSTSELRRNGVLVRLQAQPARVLRYLLAHSGRIVSRGELHNAIWGTSTFVDFERGLNVCIAQIRSALGDESSAPSYIRTVPRQGYEFICPVQRLGCEPVDDLPQPVPGSASTASRRLFFVGTAALLLISAMGLAYLNAHFHSQTNLMTIAVVRFDNETGDAQLDRFSDALTDDVIAQLTNGSQGNLRIIGNAAPLRAPRAQRDLAYIGHTLHAQFVILGQVQRIGPQTRILAHLIRMPDQTHVWVVRLNQSSDDAVALEASASREITAQFSAKLADPNSLRPLHNTASR